MVLCNYNVQYWSTNITSPVQKDFIYIFFKYFILLQQCFSIPFCLYAKSYKYIVFSDFCEVTV